MYLNYDQYLDIVGGADFATVTEAKEFTKLERNAENLFNAVTNFFYVHNDIEQDFPERVTIFRKALALQIDYTGAIGASTSYEIVEKDIKSVEVDGTSVTTGKSAADESIDGIYKLALRYLVETGLLYRGVPHC